MEFLVLFCKTSQKNLFPTDNYVAIVSVCIIATCTEIKIMSEGDENLMLLYLIEANWLNSENEYFLTLIYLTNLAN